MSGITVLFSSAGRRVALINCFRNAARQLGVSLKVVAVDLDPEWSPACQIADVRHKVPRCTSPEFVRRFDDICRAEGVSIVIPTIDPELIIHAERADSFRAMGIRALVPEAPFVRIARDKEATARWLRDERIAASETYSFARAGALPEQAFPLLAKPRDGSASVGITRICSRAELADFGDRAGYIYQELCVGDEYTINCHYKPGGGFACAVPHFRKFVRSGEVCFAETADVPELIDMARRMGEACPRLEGVICFQAIVPPDGSGPKVFEINARFGGGYPVADHAGGTFAKWILQESLGQTPDYSEEYRKGVKMLRYDEAVFT